MVMDPITLDEKVDAAISLIKEQCSAHKHPIVMSSFGKDSMVLLALIAKAGLKLPIIFHTEPFEPKKYEFSNRVIMANNYSVYDWPPFEMQVIQRGEHFEIVNRHQVAPARFDYLPIGIRDPKDGERFLCGLRDLYMKPTGGFIFQWDLVFLGHKSSDVDPILGPVPLPHDVVNDEFTAAFPLRHFTDADIWAYTVREKIPINHGRYDVKNAFKEKADISTNPDWFSVCTRCMRKDTGDAETQTEVECPQTGLKIPNVSGLLHWVPPEAFPEYVREVMAQEVAEGIQ